MVDREQMSEWCDEVSACRKDGNAGRSRPPTAPAADNNVTEGRLAALFSSFAIHILLW